MTLHALRDDPKFDTVGQVAVERNGDRIWFTESDLALSAILLGRRGLSTRGRVFDVWAGVVRDDQAGAGVGSRVSRGEAVPLASEARPSPGKP